MFEKKNVYAATERDNKLKIGELLVLVVVTSIVVKIEKKLKRVCDLWNLLVAHLYQEQFYSCIYHSLANMRVLDNASIFKV